MANVPVKWFSHLMTGAPQLTHGYGQLVAMLDACLVTGFNLKTVQSITRVGTVATVTFSTAHGYVKDQVINIYDCAQTEYSGDQRVTSATTNSLTFDVVGTPVTPGTSSADSIKCKAAPLGFEIQFSSANRRVYRSTDLTGNGNVLRVDNDAPPGWTNQYPTQASVHIARQATDVDTLVEYHPFSSVSTSFPTYGWYKWYQTTYYFGFTPNSNNNNNSAKPWVLVGDDRSFYFFNAPNANGPNYLTVRLMYGFGQINSFKPLDQYGTFLFATENYNSTGGTTPYTYSYGPMSAAFQGINLASPGEALLRSYFGTGAGTYAPKVTLATGNRDTPYSTILSGQSTGIVYPNPVDYSLLLFPSYCGDYSAGALRGVYPGLYAILNNCGTNVADLSIIDNVSNYANRKFLIVSCDNGQGLATDGTSRVAFDITGPWR